MKAVFHPSAAILNAQDSTSAGSAVITIAADTQEFWVLRKIWVSHDASGATDFDNLSSLVTITAAWGTSPITKWTTHVHPGNGGTSSLEFENGPWEFDFSPGLYVGTKNEQMVLTATTFGTGIVGWINALYQ